MNMSKYGEAYAYHGNKSKGIDELIEMWVSEIYDTPGQLSSIEKYNPADGAGHFTQVFRNKETKDKNNSSQMIWAETNKLGCGLKDCNQGRFLVCRYEIALFS